MKKCQIWIRKGQKDKYGPDCVRKKINMDFDKFKIEYGIERLGNHK